MVRAVGAIRCTHRQRVAVRKRLPARGLFRYFRSADL